MKWLLGFQAAHYLERLTFPEPKLLVSQIQQWYVQKNKLLVFTGAGLFPIIDACPKLERLDVTACRGVRVGDRRRFFEVCSFLIPISF